MTKSFCRPIGFWRIVVACVVLLALGAVGCLEIPLGSADQSTIDPRVIGFWQTDEDNGKTDLVSVEAADQHVLLIQMYTFRQADDGIHREAQSAYIAWLTTVAGQTFITIEMRDPLEVFKNEADRKRVYMVSQLTFSNDEVSLRQIKDDMAKTARTPEELARRVRVTLLHEVGHHFGLGEARLRELGWA